MADVINLRIARKRKARTDKAAKAAENRARFGRTKTEKRREALQKKVDEARLDGMHIDTPALPPTGPQH